MPVNYTPPTPESLLPVAGVDPRHRRRGHQEVDARRRRADRVSTEGSRAAGVFTQNRFCAAPVIVCREHLAHGRRTRALLINAGNANAGTGERGLADARATVRRGRAGARLRRARSAAFLDRRDHGAAAGRPDRRLRCRGACAALSPADWHAAVRAIMTTDTVPKAASRRIDVDGAQVTVTGMAKGAGMIAPNMATMLGFVATDAPHRRPLLLGAGRRNRRRVVQSHHDRR